MRDAMESFRDAMRTVGLEPPAVIEPGRFQRFAGIDKRPGNQAGWCLFFADGQGGVFGDWASGFTESWQAQRGMALSRTARRAFARQVAAARKEAEALRQSRLAKAARRAEAIWSRATPAPANHPYLLRKCIPALDARLYGDALVLPIMSFHGRLTSLQFIDGEGGKKLLSGGQKRGCFIPVCGDRDHPRRVILCEGWATGCTLAEDEPEALVLAAIDAGNLKAVALGARCRWPAAELVIAGDDDRLTPGNPGATKAQAAAQATGALLALPRWPADAPQQLTDFNDLANWLRGGLR